MSSQPINGHAAADLEGVLAASITHAQASKAPGFRKAKKQNAKARIALDGPAGSGKSYTMLEIATLLAGPDGRIAAIDTEHGSLSKYADLFEFDCDEPSSYTTEYLLQQLSWAEREGYAVFCVDSLSHFWMGKDGALEYVDAVKKRSRDQMEGWKAFAPQERQMIDRFIASPCHIIVTMRVKTEYEETVDEKGRKKRGKIGLAPVQRQGLEYEFDLVCSMDEDNGLVVSKTRCPYYAEERNRVAVKPGPEYFLPFARWLNPTAAAASDKQTAAAHVMTGANGSHPSAPAAAPAQFDKQAVTTGTADTTTPTPAAARPWTTFKEMLECFRVVKDKLPPDKYYAILCDHGVQHANQFRAAGIALKCFELLGAAAAAHAVEVTEGEFFQ